MYIGPELAPRIILSPDLLRFYTKTSIMSKDIYMITVLDPRYYYL